MANDKKYIQRNFSYANTTALLLGRLPAGAYIVEIKIQVLTAFNAGGADVVDVGKTGSAAYFANDVDVSAVNDAPVTLLKGGEVQSVNDPTDLYLIYIPAGSTVTAGAGMITIEYAYDED